MSVDMRRFAQELAEVRNAVQNLVQFGTVEKVQGNKIRYSTGNNDQGGKVLGKWSHHVNPSAGARERDFWRKGQGIAIINQFMPPMGQAGNPVIIPYGRNKQYPQPNHSNKKGYYYSYQLDEYDDDGEQEQADAGSGGNQSGSGGADQSSGQNDQQKKKMSLRGSHGSYGVDYWTQDNDDDMKGTAYQDYKDDPERHTGGDKVKVGYRLNHKTGYTARVGTGDDANRIAAVQEGSTMNAGGTHYSTEKGSDALMYSKKDWYAQAKDNFHFVVENGVAEINKPWVLGEKVKKNPIPHDDGKTGGEKINPSGGKKTGGETKLA